MANNQANGISSEYEQLYAFAERGDATSFKRLLQSGLSVNFIHPMSTDSPLMIACRKGHDEVVQVCLDYGAKNDPHPDYGQTALHAAVSANQYECASILLKVAEASEADMIISNLTDQFGQTPLHSAATIGSVRLTELLLHHGAKISSVDSYGQTALHICSGLSNEKCLAVLLDQGGDEYIEATDIYGNTPLHHAAYNGRMECVKLLLETAANVAAKNFKSFSPYNLASMQGHKQVGDLLLAYRDNSVWHEPSNTPVKYQLSTPAGKAPKDGDFQTPYTSDRLGSLRGSKDQVSPQELSVAIPEIRRNQSNQSTSSRESFDQLPRPYAVSSPAINSKNNNKSKGSAASSPVEQARKLLEQNYNSNLLIKSHTNNKYDNDYYVEELGPKQSAVEEVPILHQLATPLFVRNQSGGQSAKHGWINESDEVNAIPTFNPTNISPNQYDTPYAYPNHENVEPNEFSEDFQSSEYFDNYSSNPYVASTPVKFESYLQTNGEGEFADPLEIFDSCGITWYVYMTENQDMYFLDMSNNHSQWEDPRHYGVIRSYEDLPPDSPSKLSDTAPPLSPAFKSPYSRMSPKGPGSASRQSSRGNSETKKFTFNLSEVDISGDMTTPDDNTPSALSIPSGKNTSSSILTNSPERKLAFQPPTNRTRAYSSSSEDEKTDHEYNIRTNLNRKQRDRKANDFLDAESKLSVIKENEKLSKDEVKSIVSVGGGIKPKKVANLKDTWILQSISADPTEIVEYFNKPIPEKVLIPENTPKSYLLLADSDNNHKNAPAAKDISSNEKSDTTLPMVNEVQMKKECAKFASLILEGHQTAQEIRSLLELEKRSQQFILQVLAIVDEETQLQEEESKSNDPVTPAPNAKPVVIPVVNEAEAAEERKRIKLKELESTNPAIFTKYIKMLKMGVAEMNILSKMKMDQQTVENIKLLEDALGLNQVKKVVEDPKPYRSWQLVPEERLKNSIWAFTTTTGAHETNNLSSDNSGATIVSEGSKKTTLLPEEELQELEALFFTNTQKSITTDTTNINDSTKFNTKKAFELRMLESKRAQNIVIGLVSFKSFGSHVNVMKAICKLNSLEGQLTLDHLENFRYLLPTDSELKIAFQLKNVQHPAEVFLQTLLIFYPELPIRLNAFILCVSFPVIVAQLEKRFQIIMDMINQILSSPKLAKIMPKLLVIGQVMMTEGGNNNASSGGHAGRGKATASSSLSNKLTNSQATVLEQLLQVCSMKGVDKKTSVLDYMVKTLYDKSEEHLLGVIDDLSLLTDMTLPIASLEAIQEFHTMISHVTQLEKEVTRTQPLQQSSQETFTSPSAKAMSDEYTQRLHEYIHDYQGKVTSITKRKMLCLKKIRQLMEYFGEDPSKQDTIPIFNALRDFRRALAFSKEQTEWKLYRSQQATTMGNTTNGNNA